MNNYVSNREPLIKTSFINLPRGDIKPRVKTPIQIRKENAHCRAGRKGIEELIKYHGLPNEWFTGDEHLNGTSPTQGTERCSIVEYIYSLEEMLKITVDVFYGDNLEKAAYNGLPAAILSDMRAHQFPTVFNNISKEA